VRFFGGRIALDMRPGAEAGRNEAAALLEANGDSSSGSSCMLANFGIDSSVISQAEAPSFGTCGAVGFPFVAFLCATLFLGAGFLTGVEAASACASGPLGRDSVLVP
jgi:hypothetical protein